MSYTYSFSKVNEENRNLVGEKAYNLSIAKKYSSVPNGFVVTKEAMRFFLEKNNLYESISKYLDSFPYSAS